MFVSISPPYKHHLKIKSHTTPHCCKDEAWSTCLSLARRVPVVNYFNFLSNHFTLCVNYSEKKSFVKRTCSPPPLEDIYVSVPVGQPSSCFACSTMRPAKSSIARKTGFAFKPAGGYVSQAGLDFKCRDGGSIANTTRSSLTKGGNAFVVFVLFCLHFRVKTGYPFLPFSPGNVNAPIIYPDD